MYNTPLKERLVVQISLLICILVVIPLVLSVMYAHNKINDFDRQESLKNIAIDVERRVDYAKNGLALAVPSFENAGKQIADILARRKEPDSPTLDKKPHDAIAALISAKLAENDNYLKAQLLDTEGREVIRLQKKGSEITVVPPGQLQNKAHRFYFKHLKSTPNNQRHFHIFPPTLNRDFGTITFPPTLILRIGIPLRNKEGATIAYLVASIRSAILYATKDTNPATGFLVINEKGEYLHHWDKELLYGAEMGREANLLKEEPELRINLDRMNAKVHWDPQMNEYRVWRKLFLTIEKGGAHEARLSDDDGANSHVPFLVFMRRVPADMVVSGWGRLSQGLLALLVAVAVISLTLILFGVRYLLEPLGSLRAGLVRIGRGDEDVTLPKVPVRTEINHITDAFNVMAENLKERERELRRSNAFFRAVGKVAPNAHIIADQVGTILMVNPAVQRIFGYSESELVGQPVSLLMPSPHKEKHLSYIRRYMSEKTPRILGRVVEMEAVRKSGALFPASLYIAEAKIGVESHFIGIIADISEQKKMIEKLVRANEEVRSFANIVSHDLRAPMVNIKGFIGELKLAIAEFVGLMENADGAFSPEQRERIVEIIDDDMIESLNFMDSSATLMDRLISQILTLSRMGRRPLTFETIDTRSLVADILASFKYQTEETGVIFTIGDLPACYGDRAALEQIFSNLIGNAIKYLDENRKGKIIIEGENRPENQLYRITDNARGIAERDHAKVFEIFRRAGKQDKQGEGMGLAYVRTLVRRHQGDIWLESEENVGSTFSFTLANKKNMQEDSDAR